MHDGKCGVVQSKCDAEPTVARRQAQTQSDRIMPTYNNNMQLYNDDNGHKDNYDNYDDNGDDNNDDDIQLYTTAITTITTTTTETTTKTSATTTTTTAPTQ